ncbi:MAG TPA: carbamoyltransferase HypF [Candidatus Dormibacteraeota bacterium]|nr:carbamoyltransferase HypF [Candidatus Dormibacteraeota bacterium]
MQTTSVTASPARGTSAPVRRRLRVRGVVQGVGFRPFVWELAHRHGLAGTVCNTSGSVLIEVEGAPPAVDAFVADLQADPPRLARITAVDDAEVALRGEDGFRIVESLAVEGEYQPVSPDAATCADCLAEILDPGARRYRYPFTNCTACGPRFTIIEGLPYDRARTTMRAFPMCSECRAEYEDPSDRRFHAQPVACPACGPRLWLTGADGVEVEGDPISVAAEALRAGEVVALKGLGGFQLACDATDADAVARLRERKRRPAKPFAVMVTDLAAARALCAVGDAEAAILEGSARPVLLLRRRAEPSPIAPQVAPGVADLGLMLPCTPLHHLLLGEVGRPLVMTSGNVTEEPIAKDNDEALDRLRGIADRFLLHDRDIAARYDDSVSRVVAGEERLVRRARGHCPLPAPLAGMDTDVLALGAHLKNTFCVLRGGDAFVGPHIGDLDHPLTLRHQEESLAGCLHLFGAAPQVVACDLHPDYASTALAERRAAEWGVGAPVRVQHHHAHVASVMAEHGLRGRLLGVAFDGVGHGTDGGIWGGEFLVCDEADFQRAGHLVPVRQPGGDLCAREGWRMAAAYLCAAGLAGEVPPPWLGEGGPDERRWRLVVRVAASPTAAPLSTSAGRLFDAVASLIGAGHHSTYEAEAAMRLEALATGIDPASARAYPVAMEGEPLRVDTLGLIRALVADRLAGVPAALLAARFHESLAQAVAGACRRLAGRTGLRRVALSGGVFQNALLLERSVSLLQESGFEVYANRTVPANDGGISLGQALVAAARTRAAGTV